LNPVDETELGVEGVISATKSQVTLCLVQFRHAGFCSSHLRMLAHVSSFEHASNEWPESEDQEH
jgi:hypothetical protein